MADSNEWQRSGDKNLDQLHVYLTSEMYDCSFKVGFKESGYEIFKCHKLILSIASTVFQTMFYGHFQESKKGPDDPVLLEKVKPAAFNVAMKYIYGSTKDFINATLAVEVYKFAHEMQLDNLVADAGKYLYDVGPDNLIPVYNLFTLTENQQGMENCRMKTSQNTKLVLDSSCWLSATTETIQDVLQLDELDVSELDLFKAITRWGLAKIQDKEKKVTELRAEVDPCIKLIRFMSMESKEFAELCNSTYSTNVLSLKEKHQILLSLVLNDPECTPEKFNRSNLSRFVTDSAIICYTNFSQKHGTFAESLAFSVNKAVTLLGLEIDLNFQSAPVTRTVAQNRGFQHQWAQGNSVSSPFLIDNALGDMKFTLSDAGGMEIAYGNISNKRNVNGRDIILISPSQILETEKAYTIRLISYATTNYCFAISGTNKSDLLHNSDSKEQRPMQGIATSAGQTNMTAMQFMTRNTPQPAALNLKVLGALSYAPIRGFIFK